MLESTGKGELESTETGVLESTGVLEHRER